MNCTQAPGLILLGLSGNPENWQLLFCVFFALYLLGFLGNLLLLLAIGADVHLHTPMYFFLSQLSFVDLCFITTTAPKTLETLWTGDGSISFSGCLSQLYFFGVFADMDNLLLAVMAIDRYAAICHPLLYSLVMTPCRCEILVSGSWGVAHCVSLTQTLMLSQLFFHTNQGIPHFFCEFGPLLTFSCSDTHLNEVLLTALVGIFGIGAVLCIVISYGCIFHAVARFPSAQGKRKALATCSSHLSVVLLFYSTVFATYLKPPSSSRSSGEMVAAVMYTLVTPTLNPFIYSLRNKDVKISLRKILNMETSQD